MSRERLDIHISNGCLQHILNSRKTNTKYYLHISWVQSYCFFRNVTRIFNIFYVNGCADDPVRSIGSADGPSANAIVTTQRQPAT